jgi:hypothetical protein
MVLGQQLALSLPGTDPLCGAATAIGQPGANLTSHPGQKCHLKGSSVRHVALFALSLLSTPLSPPDTPELS